MGALRYRQNGLDFTYNPRLKITETFFSLQGEGLHTGYPCTFIRLTGCALRCNYCDTPYAFHGGSWLSFDELHQTATKHGARLIQITGGEPLHQKAVWPFIDELIVDGFKVLLETSGAVSIKGLNPGVHIVMDLKTPESGENQRNDWSNLANLKPSDEIKFVVCSMKDLEWSLNTIKEHQLDQRFQVSISPVAGLENLAAFAKYCLDSRLQIRFQVQLHKIIWGDKTGV